MKRKLIISLLCLCLLIASAVPALAFTEYGHAYDATDMLDPDFMEEYGEEFLPALSDELGMDLRVDVVSDLEGYPIEEYAEIFYDNYGYGDDFEGYGALLMLELGYDDESLHFWDFYVFSPDGDFAALANGELASYLYDGVLDGELYDDHAVCEQAFEVFAELAAEYRGGAQTGNSTAAATLAYVTDAADILYPQEIAELEARAAAISERFGCGIYIVTLDDYSDFGSSPRAATENIYADYALGHGSGRDGLILMLSMQARDYYLKTFGELGNTAFTEYGRNAMTERFLDNFGNNDWAGGFSDYLDTAEEYLEMAAEGKPFDSDTDPANRLIRLAIVILAPCIIALIVCLIFLSQMKSVRRQTAAREYMTTDSVHLRVSEDRFTHRTETRRKIEKKSSSSGGGDRSGGGGKF